MVNKKIEVEVNIVDEENTEENMTRIIIDLIKIRLCKDPQSSQPVIYDAIIDKMKNVD